MIRTGKNVTYSPDNDGVHGFDQFLFKNGSYSAIEIKTKAKCKYYPETGIDFCDYERYLKLSKKHNMPVLLVFVDENEGKIYGNYLSELAKPQFIDEPKAGKYPKVRTPKGGGERLVYFHMSSMVIYRHLTDIEIATLKSFNKRN